MKFKEITREGKIFKNWWKPKLLTLRQSTISMSIYNNDNNFQDPIIWWNIIYFLTFANKIKYNIVKGIIMLELQGLKNLSKKLLIFITKISGILKKLMNEF